jgi:hypothetical protein
VSERRLSLQRRREELLARGAAQREYVGAELDTLDAGAARIDGYIGIARRMRPALILGGLALVVLVGPRRIVGLARGTAVGSLLAHQLIRQVPGIAARVLHRLQQGSTRDVMTD